MGAQTTIMQRYFLPHPLDTIVSQPFGMTEDLVSMAMAEATSDPILASASLTVLIVSFNLARGLIFTGHTARPDNADEHTSQSESIPSQSESIPSQSESIPSQSESIPSTDSMEASTSAQPSIECITSGREFATKSVIHAQEARDWVALSSACLNTLIGVVIGFLVTGSLSIRAAFLVVVVQLMVQLLLVPVVMGRCIHPETRHFPGLVRTLSSQPIWRRRQSK